MSRRKQRQVAVRAGLTLRRRKRRVPVKLRRWRHALRGFQHHLYTMQAYVEAYVVRLACTGRES